MTAGKKKQYPKKIIPRTACQTRRSAAQLCNDNELLLAKDLIAKELKIHPKCHKNYTRICTRESAASSSSQQSNEDDKFEENTSKIDRLSEFVRDHVLEGEQSVSIKMLTEIYGLHKEDCRLRGKVKQKLLQHFDDELLFVTVSNNEAQGIMSKQVLSDTKQCSFCAKTKALCSKKQKKLSETMWLPRFNKPLFFIWLPTVESVESQERQPSGSLKLVLTHLFLSCKIFISSILQYKIKLIIQYYRAQIYIYLIHGSLK